MWKLVPALAVVAACGRGESVLDPTLSTPTPTPAAGSAAVLAAAPDLDARLARVERRLDRVVALLEQTLPPEAPGAEGVYAVPIDPIDPVEGPADARVTIAFVFELPCPACAAVSGVLDQLRAKYPDDIRIVGKYLPVHGATAVMPGLVACAAARQGKYAAVKAALWQTADLTAPAVKQRAIAAGADGVQLERDLVPCQAWLQTSQAGLRALGVTAVPTLFVNGRFAEGALRLPVVEALVTEARDRAAADIAAGIPRGAYYQRAIVERGAKRAKSRFDD